MRYEIANTGITTSSSTLKQVCSTVISEGGYEDLSGLQQACANSNYSHQYGSLPLAGTVGYPVYYGYSIVNHLQIIPNTIVITNSTISDGCAG